MKKHLIFILLAAVLTACSGEADRDMQKPSIATDGIAASPSECDTYLVGDTIHFCYRLTDNVELGNFNIEVHSNHDHHTHSTSAIECPLDDSSTPSNPWVFNQDYTIPAGSRDYVATVDIPIPHGVAVGDYHFMIRLTDRAGWQEMRSVAIKLVE